MDKLDKSILETLQRDCKISMQELAEATASSSTQCWRRVKRLQEQGVITGYRATVDPKSMGLTAIAYIHVALSDHNEKNVQAFLQIVEINDQIIECCSITGDHDFILKVVAESPEDLERFLMLRLLRNGLVSRTRSNFVLRQTKANGNIPTTMV